MRFQASRALTGLRSLIVAAASTTGLLLLGAAHGLSDKARSVGVVDVVLRGSADHERRDVDHLLADSDVALTDLDASMMDRLSEVHFIADDSLETAFHELVQVKTEDIIELSLALLQEAKLDNSSDESITLEDSARIALVQSEQLTGGLTDLGEGQLHAPDFSLAAQAVLTDDLQLSEQSVLIEGLSGRLGRLPVVGVFFWHFYMLALLSKANNNNKSVFTQCHH